MFKRLGVLGAVVAMVALVAGAVGPAAGSSGGRSDDGDVIRVVETVNEEAFIDVGEPEFSVGDQFVFSSTLTKNGKEVGIDGGVCTFTSVDPEVVAQCQATAELDGGQITVQGLITGEPERFTLPITGGSGKYEGAEGELKVHDMSDTKDILTFHLSN